MVTDSPATTQSLHPTVDQCDDTNLREIPNASANAFSRGIARSVVRSFAHRAVAATCPLLLNERRSWRGGASPLRQSSRARVRQLVVAECRVAECDHEIRSDRACRAAVTQPELGRATRTNEGRASRTPRVMQLATRGAKGVACGRDRRERPHIRAKGDGQAPRRQARPGIKRSPESRGRSPSRRSMRAGPAERTRARGRLRKSERHAGELPQAAASSARGLRDAIDNSLSMRPLPWSRCRDW